MRPFPTLVVASALSVLACSGPVAPSVGVSTITVTVRVLEYQTEYPLPGATVSVDAVLTAQTGLDGTVAVPTCPGHALTLSASAPGYRPSLTVTGTPYTHERWTFYLEPVAVSLSAR